MWSHFRTGIATKVSKMLAIFLEQHIEKIIKICDENLLNVCGRKGAKDWRIFRLPLALGGALVGRSGASAGRSVLESCLSPVSCGEDDEAIYLLSPRFIDFQASQRFGFSNPCSSTSHKSSRVPFAPASQRFYLFESVQFSLAQTEQSALCTFFIYFLQALLRRFGLIVSSPVISFSPG